jgi:hypothetical protein
MTLLNNGNPPEAILVDSPAFQKTVTAILEKFSFDIPVRLERSFMGDLRLKISTLYNLMILIYIFICSKLARPFYLLSQLKDIVLIDTFILKKYLDSDRYYPGLFEKLPQKDKDSLHFAPTFLDFGFSGFFPVIKKLRKANVNFILKEDFLKFRDYFFSIGHFFRRRSIKIKECFYEGMNFSGLMREDINSWNHFGSAVSALLNYRFSMRLSWKGATISCIVDWFENQPIDKGWNAGFNKHYPDVPSKGYVGYLQSNHYLCQYPTPLEKQCKMLPNSIAVMGQGLASRVREFCPDMPVEVAPAFRFSGVYSDRKAWPEEGGSNILLGLSFIFSESLEMLGKLEEALTQIDSGKIKIYAKAHPSISKEKLMNARRKSLPDRLELVEGDFMECLEKSNLFIGNASSTCLEALARGIPVIVLGGSSGLMHNPIPESVPTEFYRLCVFVQDLVEAIKHFENSKLDFDFVSEFVKREFFSPVTENAISDFLNINKTV